MVEIFVPCMRVDIEDALQVVPARVDARVVTTRHSTTTLSLTTHKRCADRPLLPPTTTDSTCEREREYPPPLPMDQGSATTHRFHTAHPHSALSRKCILGSYSSGCSRSDDDTSMGPNAVSNLVGSLSWISVMI